MGGRIPVESLAGLVWNSQFTRQEKYQYILSSFGHIFEYLLSIEGYDKHFEVSEFVHRLDKDFLAKDQDYVCWKTEYLRKFREDRGLTPLNNRKKSTQNAILRLIKK
jgi:hypothetical protein